jgi:hypothetical protein
MRLDKFNIIILLFFSFTFSNFAQVSDLARLEYAYFPQKQSENSFKRLRAGFCFPIKLNDKDAYLVPGFEYRNVNFDFEDQVNFDTFRLNDYDSYELTLGYTYKIKPNLRFAATSGVLISSNFETKKIISEDVLFSGSVYIINDQTKNTEYKKPWRLILGLGYSTSAGFPLPLPIINYYREFRPKWSFTLGIPKMNLKYDVTEKSSVQTFVTLDGFFANIQNNRATSISNTTNAVAENISMTVAYSGLGYEYNLMKYLQFYTYIGHTFINNIRLLDGNRNDVYTINDKNTFYFRGGFKVKI